MAMLVPGTVLADRFEIRSMLGRGATAAVYEAYDNIRGEPVALKVLHTHLSGDPILKARLQREVKAASSIRHPNALVALDIHRVEDRLAISMPLFRGEPLKDHVARSGPMPLESLRELWRSIGGALREAHRQGILHRDVTPTNVLCDEERFVLSDFGLARVEAMKTVTATAALGTCGYSAPELFQGRRGDPTADVYGLGAILYFAAVGKGPFDGPGPVASLSRQLQENHVPLGQLRPDLPRALAALIDRCLARHPNGRPVGVQALLKGLERTSDGASVFVVTPTVEVNDEASKGLSIPLPLPPGSWTVTVDVSAMDDWEQQQRPRADGDSATGKMSRKRLDSSQAGPFWAEPQAQLLDMVAQECEETVGPLPTPAAFAEDRFRVVTGVSQSSAERLLSGMRLYGFVASAIDARPVGDGSLLDTYRAQRPKLVAGSLPLLVMSSVVFGNSPTEPLALLGGLLASIAPVWAIVEKFRRRRAPDNIPYRAFSAYLFLVLLSVLPSMASLASAAKWSIVAVVGALLFAVMVFVYAMPLGVWLRRRAVRRKIMDTPAAFESERADIQETDPERVFQGSSIVHEAAATPGHETSRGGEEQEARRIDVPPPEGIRRFRQLARVVKRKLGRLEEWLENAQSKLPEIVCTDLRSVVCELRGHHRAICTEAELLAQRLAGIQSAPAEEAALQLTQDLRRLESRQAAGLPVDAADVDGIRAAIAAHGRTVAESWRLETAAIRLHAELLEMDSAVAEAESQLTLAEVPEAQLAPILSILHARASDTSAALAEVAALEASLIFREGPIVGTG